MNYNLQITNYKFLEFGSLRSQMTKHSLTERQTVLLIFAPQARELHNL